DREALPATPTTANTSLVTVRIRDGHRAQGHLTRAALHVLPPDCDPLTYSWSALRGSFTGAADAASARWG
ncbi:MAG: hypothetical protein OXG35_11875, partial [Acidobacteria bacterium]|nr:hypothetical protein [Acidobacteriota bacterium]